MSDMKVLVNNTYSLAMQEYKRASLKFGTVYSSPHEAYAVLLEEVQEASEELGATAVLMKDLWENIRADNYEETERILADMFNTALAAASEMIQVAAVAHKASLGYKRNTGGN